MNAVAQAVTGILRSNKPARQVTANGLSLVQHAEGEPGTGKAVLVAYRDSKGIPTIGWGHTDGVYLGQTCTETQALAWLDDDLDEAESAVCELVKVPLSDAQFDALVSLVFNIGRTQFATSTLLRVLNKGDYAAAAAQFPAWNKITVAGKLEVSKGLTNRRASEAALFTSGSLPGVAAANEPVSVAQLAPDDQLIVSIKPPPTLPAVPPVAVVTSMANEVPTAPPSSIVQSPGGKTGLAAIATGAAGILTEGWQQVQPVVSALHRIADGTASGSGVLRVVGAVLAVVSIGFLLFSAWNQHRAVSGRAP